MSSTKKEFQILSAKGRDPSGHDHRNPSLIPGIRATQLDAGGRAVDIAVYRIQPEMIDGRKTV